MSSQNYNLFPNSGCDNNDEDIGQHTQNTSSYENSTSNENQPGTNTLPPPVNSSTPRQPFQFGSLTQHDLTSRGYFPPPGLPPLRQQGFYYGDSRQTINRDPAMPIPTTGEPRPRPRPTPVARAPHSNPTPPFSSLPAPHPLTPDDLLHQQIPMSVVPPQSTRPPVVRQDTQGSDGDDVQSPASKKWKKAPSKQQTRPVRKVDKELSATKGRGRTKEASAYSNDEMRKVVEFYEEVIPIGRRGCEEVVCLYNEWAKSNGFPERQLQPLQMKWNNMVRTATEHPTGDGERLQIYEDVLRAEEAANERVACGDLQDDSEQEDEEDIIDISSGDDEGPSTNVKKKTKGKGKGKEKQDEKKGTTVMKAYRTEPPLPPRDTTTAASRTSRARQASAALQSIAAASDPKHQQQVLEQRTQCTLQLFQFQHLQSQVTSLTQQVGNLTSRLHQEQMRTMAAENQLQTMQLMLRFQGQGSGLPFDSPRSHRTPRRARSQYDYHRQHSRYDRSPSPNYYRLSQRDRSRSPILPSRTPSSPLPLPSPTPSTTTITPVPTVPPVPPAASVASGSRVTLEVLADAADHLESGQSYSIRPHPDGKFDIE
ncbi:hypothetical protein PM082_023362 [Marasmius tenuissimus]|nr:hypothetical protein PM082_023362 [Marasmius tenuissimus]